MSPPSSTASTRRPAAWASSMKASTLALAAASSASWLAGALMAVLSQDTAGDAVGEQCGVNSVAAVSAVALGQGIDPACRYSCTVDAEQESERVFDVVIPEDQGPAVDAEIGGGIPVDERQLGADAVQLAAA